MKFEITVELLHGENPVTPKDLKSFGSINFLKAAPKAFKRAMKATCWPFNANVSVEIVEKSHDKRNPKGRGKRHKNQ